VCARSVGHGRAVAGGVVGVGVGVGQGTGVHRRGEAVEGIISRRFPKISEVSMAVEVDRATPATGFHQHLHQPGSRACGEPSRTIQRVAGLSTVTEASWCRGYELGLGACTEMPSVSWRQPVAVYDQHHEGKKQ
jgi:hypothetical protein